MPQAAPATVESFCERCGTRYSFGAPPVEKKRFGSGLGALLGLTDPEAAVPKTAPLDPFLAVFRFCLECRQYTCPSCWNEEAGFCVSCVPPADIADRNPVLMDDPAPPSDFVPGHTHDLWPTVDLLLEPAHHNGAEPKPAFFEEPDQAIESAWERLVDESPVEATAVDAFEPTNWAASFEEDEVAPAVEAATEVVADLAPAVQPIAAAPEFEVQSHSDLGTEAEWEIAAAREPELVVEADVEPEEVVDAVEAVAESDVEAAIEAVEAAAELEVEAVAEAAVEPEMVAETVVEPPLEVEAVAVEPDVVAVLEPEVEVEAVGVEPEMVAEAVLEPQVEVEAVEAMADDLEAVAEADVEPEMVAETVAEPDVEAVADVEADPEVSAAVEPEAIATQVADDVAVDAETVAEVEPELVPTLTFAEVEPEPEVSAVAADAELEVEPEVEVAATEPEVASEVEPEPEATLTFAEVEPQSLFEPAASQPEPELQPEPVAAQPEPEPVAAQPEPVAAQPEPVAAQPEPVAVEPKVPPMPLPTAVPTSAPLAGWQLTAPDVVEPLVVEKPSAPTWPPLSPVYQPPSPRPFGLEAPNMPLPMPGVTPTVAPGAFAQLPQVPAGMLMRAPANQAAPHTASGIRPCSSCGLALSSVARFCRRCGSRQG